MTWLRRLSWTVTILYWIALAVATHLPPEDVHIPPSIGDKLIHAGAYFGLALLIGISLSLTLTLSRRMWIPLYVIAFVMAYGAVDEWTQPLMRRSCELNDWFADVSGASAAAVILLLARRLVSTKHGGPSLAGAENVLR